MDSLKVRVLVVATFAAAFGGCKSDSPVDPLTRAMSVQAVSAVDFGGVVGTVATSAPAVRVTDKDGDPVSNVAVTFAITAGGGSISPSVVMTDADGRASTAWTLGTAAATQTLKASVGTLEPVVFIARAVAGPASAVERVSGDNQIVAVGSAAGAPIKARVVDVFHNPVRGASVAFSVVSGGGTITPSTAITDSTGVVSANWTVGPVEGVQTAQAQVGAVSVLFSVDTFSCTGATGTAACSGMGELVFVRTPDSEIYRMNVDGSGFTKLTLDGFSNSNPVWSPDGKRIAFIRFVNGIGSDVFLMNPDGSNVVRRTTGGAYYSVTWSPDGRSLAVEAATGGDSLNIFTMSADPDGRAPVLLISNGGSPSWSPDGKKIAYSHGTGYYDAAQIYVRNADGTDVHRATPDSSGWNWYSQWSPDGKKIAFTRCVLACGTYILDLSSLVVTLVTPTPGSQDASWSPDGRWLAMTVYSTSGPSISYVPSTGGSPRSILPSAYSPSWRPPTH